jgi:hypothetical protein
MGQVTIYLEDEIERKMNAAVKSAHISKSKWVAQLIENKVAHDWPDAIVAMAGSWKDFPSIEEIKGIEGTDVKREQF